MTGIPHVTTSTKRVMVAGTQLVSTADAHGLVFQQMLPKNRWVDIGDTINLTEAEALTVQGVLTADDIQ